MDDLVSGQEEALSPVMIRKVMGNILCELLSEKRRMPKCWLLELGGVSMTQSVGTLVQKVS